MSAIGLTAKQAQVLAFVRARLAETGVAPSLAEISRELGNSYRSSAHAILRGLRKRGLVDWSPHMQRSLRLCDEKLASGLPATVALRLENFCRRHGERPADVIADAVLLHIDELEEAA